jgi:hypothetical protein
MRKPGAQSKKTVTFQFSKEFSKGEAIVKDANEARKALQAKGPVADAEVVVQSSNGFSHAK